MVTTRARTTTTTTGRGVKPGGVVEEVARGRGQEGSSNGETNASGDASSPRKHAFIKGYRCDERLAEAHSTVADVDSFVRDRLAEALTVHRSVGAHARASGRRILVHDISTLAFARDDTRYCTSCKQCLSPDCFPGWHRKTCAACLQCHKMYQRRRRKQKMIRRAK